MGMVMVDAGGCITAPWLPEVPIGGTATTPARTITFTDGSHARQQAEPFLRPFTYRPPGRRKLARGPSWCRQERRQDRPAPSLRITVLVNGWPLPVDDLVYNHQDILFSPPRQEPRSSLSSSARGFIFDVLRGSLYAMAREWDNYRAAFFRFLFQSHCSLKLKSGEAGSAPPRRPTAARLSKFRIFGRVTSKRVPRGEP